MSYLQSSSVRCALLTILLFATIMLGCSKDEPTAPPNDPAKEPILASDYFFVRDTSDVVILREQTFFRMVEPFLTEEAIIGEPFTDVNGNGVYDNGIDGFVRSSDPATNQDLNYNGRHDGPENMQPFQWERPIPFDDLDGNGTIRLPSDLTITPDCAYAPFVDWNGNGTWDSVIYAGYKHVRWYKYAYYDSWEARISVNVGPEYFFVSDSGKEYIYHGNFVFPYFVMYHTQYGWTINCSSVSFPVFDSAAIVPRETDTVWIRGGTYSGSAFVRHTTIDTSVSLGDSLFTNLLHISFDSMLAESRFYPDFLHWKWDFYFSKEIGLCAFNLRQVVNGEIKETYCSFAERFVGTLPLPMTKVNRP